MPSCNTYHLTWVSLTLDMGYLFPAAPVLPGWDVTGAAERSYLTSEVRGCGREELPHLQGAAAARAQEGLEELFHVQGQKGRREEIPLIQDKEQQLRSAGAAVKRYPMSKVRETQVRR